MSKTARPSIIGLRSLFIVGLLGVFLGLIALSPVSANHTPAHTKKQIRALQKSVKSLKATVSALQGTVSTVQGTVNNLSGTVNNLNQLQYVSSPPLLVPNGFIGTVEAVCPAGTFVTGGGGFSSTIDGFQADSYPSHGVGPPWAQGRTGWTFEWTDTAIDTSDSTIRAFAICAKVGTTGGNYTPGTPPLRATAAVRAR